MNYRDREIERFRERTERFMAIFALPARQDHMLEQEGALIIASVLRVAGPQALARFADSYLSLGHANEGLCPEDHVDDRSLHPIWQDGVCLECRAKEALL